MAVVTTTARLGGHITLAFTVHSDSEELHEQGSMGIGLCIEAGLSTSCRSDPSRSSGLMVISNGLPIDSDLHRLVLEECARFDPSLYSMHHTFDLACELPFSQGFGLSAAGSITAARCLIAHSDIPLHLHEPLVWAIAHRVERRHSGGLGDVTALHAGGVVRRITPGATHQIDQIEPVIVGTGPGRSDGWGSSIPLLLAWRPSGSKHTSTYIDSEGWSQRIRIAGEIAMETMSSNPWDMTRWPEIIDAAHCFAKQSGLIEDSGRASLLDEVRWALKPIEKDIEVMLCMLGESVVVVPRELDSGNRMDEAENLLVNLTSLKCAQTVLSSIS
ncbi:MAG TPA: hypothetical protein HA345_02870 [Candidatus Thalassarchaeaceae archaeon]|nr:MAG TPA: hypothetical protein D7H94_02860 [Candidatus Poseidoniales archaeon]HIH84331.1 hypothetical protein [Candidatus Thalassarchaeaceae archaeon]